LGSEVFSRKLRTQSACSNDPYPNWATQSMPPTGESKSTEAETNAHPAPVTMIYDTAKAGTAEFDKKTSGTSLH
jgi:hypothetical protein